MCLQLCLKATDGLWTSEEPAEGDSTTSVQLAKNSCHKLLSLLWILEEDTEKQIAESFGVDNGDEIGDVSRWLSI